MQNCLSFSAAQTKQVNAQNMFSGSPQAVGRIAAAYQKSLRWTPGENIVICFLNGTDYQRKFVEDTIKTTFFNKNKDANTCNLNLKLSWINRRGGTQPTNEQKAKSNVRIGFDEQGAWSFLGTANKDMAKLQDKTMNFGWLDDGPTQAGGVVKHEVN